ncbi:hypothetical protein HDU97_003358 [Phlyctochytrium planicorne]|nr:hypothetical protein HDU97_003358 [Phlyctochytrium planicorne]
MDFVLEQSRTIYKSLPVGGKRFINDIAPYADMAVWTIVMTVFLSSSQFLAINTVEIDRPNLSPKKGSVALVLLCGFLFLIVGLFLYFFASQMAIAQIANKYDEDQENFDAASFLPGLPLDITFGYDAEGMATFLVALGENGKTSFANYLYTDIVGIILYTVVHLNLMAYFYPDDDSMSFMTSKLPWAFAAFDLYENLGLLVAISVGPAKMSEQFLLRVISANATKFGLFWIVLGLEFAGLIRLMMGDVTKSITDSGVTITGTSEQKAADARRKQRLEKKGK